MAKNNWNNEETKGIHYEVWSSCINDRNLYGNNSAEFYIGLHVEGRKAPMPTIIRELEKVDIIKTYRYIVEQCSLILNFENEVEIKKSIDKIIQKIKYFDEKYTTKIEEALKRIKSNER